MTQQTLNDFKKFFKDYQGIWNRCDANEMCQVCSEELHVRWAYPGNTVADWGCEQACEGWKQAFISYSGRSPKWTFHEVSSTAVSESEVMALFWVTFEIDGKPTQEANLFVETFRKEPSGWKLIRSYVESSLPRMHVGI